jgi:predicted metal-dependent peptidase
VDLTAKPPAVQVALAALRAVRLHLPHLAGLTAVVTVEADARVPTAGITASGRILVNPDWFPAQPAADRLFVMAHELLHLCLRTHDREDAGEAERWNWAHDYIINDMLRHELGATIPAGGLDRSDARHESAELLVELIKRGEIPGPGRRRRPPRSALSAALADAGLVPHEADASDVVSPGSGDVIGRRAERTLFPTADRLHEAARLRRVTAAARRALALEALRAGMDRHTPGTDGGGDGTGVVSALRASYRPPWELALQRWMDAVAPGPRSYARPNRRGADAVLPGRRRDGWAVHVVLDTSGSMVDALPRMLGAVGAFAEAAGVAAVRVLQCDAAVTRDDWLDVTELHHLQVAGFGGSDMSPALLALADDPEVSAAVVLTDGCIDYPAEPPPFEVLWGLDTDAAAEWFRPPYGVVVPLPPG